GQWWLLTQPSRKVPGLAPDRDPCRCPRERFNWIYSTHDPRVKAEGVPSRNAVMLRKPWFLLALVFPIVFSGCKKTPSNREVHPVKGKVTLDGEPVRLAVIYLEPKDPAIGNEAKGYIRE